MGLKTPQSPYNEGSAIHAHAHAYKTMIQTYSTAHSTVEYCECANTAAERLTKYVLIDVRQRFENHATFPRMVGPIVNKAAGGQFS